MTRYLAGLIAALMVLTSAPAGAQRNAKADATMAAAWQKENLEHDLPGAIKLYREVATKYGKTDPATAAMALVRAGDAYRKMGDTESRRLYEQVLNRFGDQKDAMALAQARLRGDSSVERSEGEGVDLKPVPLPWHTFSRRPFLFLRQPPEPLSP